MKVKIVSVRFLILTIMLGMMVFSGACGTGTGQPGKTQLLIYSPHGPELLKEMKTRFEKANPGIEIQFLDIASQEILNRLSQERANPQADVWWGASSLTYAIGAEDGLLEPYKPTWAASVDPEAHDPQDRWYATYQTPEVIVYNHDLVKEADVAKDWDDLLDERWRGHILIRQPLQSDTMRTIFGAIILRSWQASGNGPQGGYDWLKKLDANTKDYVTDGTQLMQKIGRGEGWLSIWNMPDVVLHQRKNLPLSFLFPKSGTPIVTDGIAIVKGTQHGEAARKFYEFVTTPDSLTFAAKQFDRMPARKDIDRANLPEWMRAEITPMRFDQATLGKEIKGWMQYWETNIRKR